MAGSAADVASVAKYAQQSLQHTLADIASRSMSPLSPNRQVELSDAFHHDILELIELDMASPVPKLARQSSGDFIQSFQRADSLLVQGAEGLP